MVRVRILPSTPLLAVALLARQVQAFAPPPVVSFFVTTATSTRSKATITSATSTTGSLRMSSSAGKTVKRVLVPIGTGSEEIETTCLTDTLARFGAEVTVASVMTTPGDSNNLVCTMSRGIKFLADVSIADAAKEEWDLIALPGGMPGSEHLRDSKDLVSLLESQKKQGKLYAALCAAPAVALAPNGLIDEGAAATCYPVPPFRAALSNPVNDDVVVTKNLITSQGPGTSLKAALQLGEELYGKKMADEIAAQMLVKR